MKAALYQQLVEEFREPNTFFLSPARVGDFFGFEVHEIAARAHVHRNIPATRPHAQQLQTYLQDMLRVLAAAIEITEESKRAAFLVRNEPLRPFGYKTAIRLVEDGRVEDVVAYLESLSGGAAG